MAKKLIKSPELLCWKFFISKYDLKNKQIQIALEFCDLICNLDKNATVDIVKTTYQYGHVITGLDSSATTDVKIQEMIDAKF